MATELMAEAFEPGDPRKDATLLYFRKSDSDPVTPENTNTPYGESPVSQAEGAYFNKKAYTNPALRQEFTNKGFWVNIRLIRYSDVVLMAAESANELGNTSEAQKDLEMVRAVRVAVIRIYYLKLLLWTNRYCVKQSDTSVGWN